jgi:hypothetical protein
VLIGQPAEETVSGAAAVLRAGLFTKFPKPDYVLALHDSSSLPAGIVAWREGPMLAGADSVDITIRGYGGHGAAPNATKDPLVIACELVVFLQTIVSREMDPQQPTVVTVGSFHAGTKHNIIPDDAHLQLTVRTMTPEQREKVLAAIKRATNGIAEAAGVPADRAPILEVAKDAVPATINDSALSRRVAVALEKALGKENVVQAKPIMASEDFSLFALADPKPPTMMFSLGAVDPAKIKESRNAAAESAFERVSAASGARDSDGRESHDQRSDRALEKVERVFSALPGTAGGGGCGGRGRRGRAARRNGWRCRRIRGSGSLGLCFARAVTHFLDDSGSTILADLARGIVDAALRQGHFAAAGAGFRVEFVQSAGPLFRSQARSVDAGEHGGTIGMLQEDFTGILKRFDSRGDREIE